jgi:hypothetical protein
MEPTRTLGGSHHEGAVSTDAVNSDRRTLPGITQKGSHRTQGHRFKAVTTQDNARVHMGDVHGGQHTHYHEAPSSQHKAKEISLLDALAFEQMDFRSATIAHAYAKTCDWLFSASPYKRWRDQALVSEHNGFLWIKGKPGAGKSTVMKHAWEYAQVTYEDETTLSFFFNARGTTLGKSVQGIYRCLLHQIVGQVPDLSSKVAAADRELYRSKGWPVEVLQDLFRQAVLHLCRHTSVSCYIDALDEGDDEDQVRGMIEFFYDLAERHDSDDLPFYVCLASRYYPKISVLSFEELRLEDHEGHDTDISEYVHNKLRLGSGQLKQQLASEINLRSSGVFLWVVLVVAILNKEGDRGNQHLLSARLQGIPDGLLQLFQDLMTRVAPDDRFLPAIQCVLYAGRPLTPKDLYIAILASIGELTAQRLTWTWQTVNTGMINDFIISSSKGLLEVDYNESYSRHRGPWWPSHDGYVVQFIHETVREYFLGASEFENQEDELGASKNRPGNMSELDSRSPLDIAAISHARLSQICQAYIRISHTNDLQQNPQFGPANLSDEELRERPYLTYSVEMALTHANNASDYGRRVSNLAQEFPWDEWISYRSVTDPLFTDDLYRIDTWLQMMAYEGYHYLLKDELTLSSRRGNGEFHLLINACAEGLGSALHISLRRRNLDCYKWLLDSGADVNMMCKGVGSPLHVAVSKYDGNINTVRLLLEYGADPNAKDNHGNSAVHYSILGGYVDILELLAEHGGDLKNNIGTFGNAAQTAASQNDWRAMQALSELGVDVDAQNFSPEGLRKSPDAAYSGWSKAQPAECRPSSDEEMSSGAETSSDADA